MVVRSSIVEKCFKYSETYSLELLFSSIRASHPPVLVLHRPRLQLGLPFSCEALHPTLLDFFSFRYPQQAAAETEMFSATAYHQYKNSYAVLNQLLLASSSDLQPFHL